MRKRCENGANGGTRVPLAMPVRTPVLRLTSMALSSGLQKIGLPRINRKGAPWADALRGNLRVPSALWCVTGPISKSRHALQNLRVFCSSGLQPYRVVKKIVLTPTLTPFGDYFFEVATCDSAIRFSFIVRAHGWSAIRTRTARHYQP